MRKRAVVVGDLIGMLVVVAAAMVGPGGVGPGVVRAVALVEVVGLVELPV